MGNDQTDITTRLNGYIVPKDGTVYGGGKGVLIRNINDGLLGDVTKKVVPGSFLTDDIVAASIAYPNGNPFCPTTGYNGFQHLKACTDNPWINAVVLAVVGSSMGKLFPHFDTVQTDPNWGWGVFYGTDSNSVDQRCRFLSSSKGYDCPGFWIDMHGRSQTCLTCKGAGGYAAGNPLSSTGGGGGAGCHVNKAKRAWDQFDADSQENLVSGYSTGGSDCQCNYNLKGNGWQDWVMQWIQHAKAKPGFSWEAWLGPGKKLAPGFAVDLTACWVNNPRDMIYIQNMMWFHRFEWDNQLMPQSSWDFNANDAASQRRYWGWNEVPVDAKVVNDPRNWDAVVIKLPAAICPRSSGGGDSLKCLSASAQIDLQTQLDWYVSKNLLKVGEGFQGSRPGSYVVLMREYLKDKTKTGQWARYFFCESWNSNKYQIVYKAPTGGGNTGECYLDHGTGPPPVPPSPPPVPKCVGNTGRFEAGSDNSKCFDIPGGNVYNGAPVQMWDCNHHTNQNFIWCQDGRIVSAMNDKMCLDVPGGDPKKATFLQMWDCNGMGGQYWEYDAKTMSIFPAQTGETMCVDTDDGSVKPGTKVNLWYCKPGTGMAWVTATTCNGENCTTVQPELSSNRANYTLPKTLNFVTV